MNALVHNARLDSLLRFLPKIASVILVIILGSLLARLAWLVMTPVAPITVSLSSGKSAQPVKVEQTKDYGKIVANYHLFGEVKRASKPVEKPKTVPETRLNLKLFGIVARTDHSSYAIIASASGQQGVFSVGESPQPGVKVDSIHPDKVILNHNGRLETLRLPKKAEIKYTSPVPVRHANNNLQNLPPVTMPGMHQGAIDNTLPIDDLAELRDALVADPSRLTEIANAVEAKNKDGEFLGFRLSPGKNRKAFRKLGLNPGDIVTQVNGIQLDTPAKGITLLGELADSSSLVVTVKRGDQEITITKNF